MNKRRWPWICGAVAAGLLCGYAGYRLALPPPEDVASAPEARQGDGSLVLARDPAKPKPAPHSIPARAREERRVSVTVQPAKPDCPRVTVDLSLVREGDGRRVIASSPDGVVVGGLDVPIASGHMPVVRPWATGASYDIAGAYGLWLERDIGRIRLGADVGQDPRGGMQARVRVGWTF